MFCREVKIDTHLAEGIAAIAGPHNFYGDVSCLKKRNLIFKKQQKFDSEKCTYQGVDNRISYSVTPPFLHRFQITTSGNMTARSFHQYCPVCGRQLQIDTKLVNTNVVCQHCGGTFLATAQKSHHCSNTIFPASQRAKIESLLLQGSRVIHSRKVSRC